MCKRRRNKRGKLGRKGKERPEEKGKGERG